MTSNYCYRLKCCPPPNRRSLATCLSQPRSLWIDSISLADDRRIVPTEIAVMGGAATWHAHGVHVPYLFGGEYKGCIDLILVSSAGLNTVCSYAQIVQLKFKMCTQNGEIVQLTVKRIWSELYLRRRSTTIFDNIWHSCIDPHYKNVRSRARHPSPPNLRTKLLLWSYTCERSWFLVPGSSGVEDVLGDTNPPASLVLSSVASCTSFHPIFIFLGSLLMIPYQFWRGRSGLLPKPSGSQWWACRGSCDIPCVKDVRATSILTWGMQSPLWLSHLSPCPSRKCPGCFSAIYGVLLQVSSFEWLRLATIPHCIATWRELVLHIALFSPINWFSCSSIFWIV